MTEASDALGASYERIGAAALAESEREVARQLASYREMGIGGSAALDYWAVEIVEIPRSEWAAATDRGEGAVRESLDRARQAFNEAVEGEESSS